MGCVLATLGCLVPADASLLALDESGGSERSDGTDTDPLPRTVRTGLTWSMLLNPTHTASGGSCDVYEASLEGERIAIKLVRDNNNGAAVRDLEREAHLLTEFGRRPHRHLITLIGQGHADDGRPFLVLELLACTLADVLPKPRVLLLGDQTDSDEVGVCTWAMAAAQWPLHRALACAGQLAEALRYLHEEQPLPDCRSRILHRDLKPDNIGFLATTGALVLLDFGLAHTWQRQLTAPSMAEVDGIVAAPSSSMDGGGAGASEVDRPRPVGAGLGGQCGLLVDHTEDEARLLTGQTGSQRYMAPEVGAVPSLRPKSDTPTAEHSYC